MDSKFRGVWIPRDIWLAELTLQEKVFLAEIESLDNESGCYASNKYFSEFFGLSKNRCSEIINSLKKKKFIQIVIVREKNKKSISKRIIKVVEKSNTSSREIDKPSRKVEGGWSEKGEENNTLVNNTINSNNNIYSQLLNYWNEKGINENRDMNQNVSVHLSAELKKYNVDDLKKAIDNYTKVLVSPEHYWTFELTFKQFIRPSNVTQFLDEADPLNVFLRSKPKNNKPVAIKFDPSIDRF